MQIEFEIQGKVKAKQSCRMTQGGIKYTPADVKSYANWVRLSFKQIYPDWLPSMFQDKQLMCEIDAYYLIPKSFSKTKKQFAKDGFIRPTVKPDCDNISKNICDALNGFVFPDDKQIVTLTVRKWYSENEYVNIKVMEV